MGGRGLVDARFREPPRARRGAVRRQALAGLGSACGARVGRAVPLLRLPRASRHCPHRVRLHGRASAVRLRDGLPGEMSSPVVSVVVPVFNEEDGLPELHERLRACLPPGSEIVYVDDGSLDGSAELLEQWARSEPGVVLVSLSRNFGMEVAMSAG